MKPRKLTAAKVKRPERGRSSLYLVLTEEGLRALDKDPQR